MSEPVPASVFQRRRLVAGAIVALAVLLVGALVIRLTADDPEADAAGDRTTTTLPADALATSTTRPAPTTTTVVSTGRFTKASGRSEVAGTGPVQTYTVEVEEGIDIDVQGFAAQVDATLADPRGWTTADGVALQRIDHGPATFTVRLATPDTTDVLCFPLQTGGAVSCANEQAAVLNLTRWEEGAAPSKLDLPAYRQYLVSHEVGHLLGHDHVPCPGPGVPAPTMVQQTLGIGECTPNPWPVPDAQPG